LRDQIRDYGVPLLPLLLNRLQAIIRVMENSKFELVSELEKIQSEREQLQQTQAQLEQTQAQLEQTQAQLEQTQAQLEQEQETITTISSSKFWKLRTAWFKLKRAIGLTEQED